MAAFVFNAIKGKVLRDEISFASDFFYLRLVTSTPAQNMATSSQLTEAAGGTYAPKALINKLLVDDATGVFLDCDDITFASLTTTAPTAIVGSVLCKFQPSSNIPAGGDLVVAFNELNSPFTPNGSSFSLIIPTTGLVRLT